MKRLFAIVCLLALLLCACAEPEPAHVQEPISQPEDVGQAAEASEKTALLSPAAARMADLTAADIHYTDFDVDADALCSRAAGGVRLPDTVRIGAMPHYMLTVYLTETFSSAAENFFLTAGLDEPYVRINYRDPEGGSHDAVFENETLYWLLRDIYRVEPDIDEAALAKYQDILDASAQKKIADSLALADVSGFPGYTGFEIYRLVKTDTFADGDDTYDVYSWNAAFLTDEPDQGSLRGRYAAGRRRTGAFRDGKHGLCRQKSRLWQRGLSLLHWGIYQGETEQAQAQNAGRKFLPPLKRPRRNNCVAARKGAFYGRTESGQPAIWRRFAEFQA